MVLLEKKSGRKKRASHSNFYVFSTTTELLHAVAPKRTHIEACFFVIFELLENLSKTKYFYIIDYMFLPGNAQDSE